MKFTTWIKIAITIFCLIMLTIGFAMGYIYSNNQNKECIEKPFSYGIDKLNRMNHAEFTCSCMAVGMQSFSFNDEGLLGRK